MPSESHHQHRRSVRSYVLRAGRLTPSQQKALDELYPRFGVPAGDAPLDLVGLFGRAAATIVEIGFGNGEATWRMARDEADKNFIGVEVHPPGVGRLLQSLKARGIGNVRVAMTDAVTFLEQRIAPASLDGVRIYFPDPWPKKRHHKRRIIQPDFVQLLADRIKVSGILHLATDWVPYAEHMLKVVTVSDAFDNLSPTGEFSARPDWRPATKYERRGEGLGHETHDMLFRKSL